MRARLPLAALFTCLSLVSCRERQPSAGPDPNTPKPEAVGQVDAASAKEIEALQLEIERSEHAIGDLEAAVVMERAKVADDPDYDQSFLNETLAEQEGKRAEIEEARKRIEELGGAGK